MSDPMTSGPSEEELRAYLERLRGAEPVEILVQAFGILATAAEVKLGRPDARTLIDAMAALFNASEQHIPAELGARMRQSITQLQMAQVEAERDAATASPDDAQAAASGTGATQPPPAGQPPAGQGPQESPASRLWIPGRD